MSSFFHSAFPLTETFKNFGYHTDSFKEVTYNHNFWLDFVLNY